jgi:hypothetical protein
VNTPKPTPRDLERETRRLERETRRLERMRRLGPVEPRVVELRQTQDPRFETRFDPAPDPEAA